VAAFGFSDGASHNRSYFHQKRDIFLFRHPFTAAAKIIEPTMPTLNDCKIYSLYLMEQTLGVLRGYN